jgi:hypothetical protein
MKANYSKIFLTLAVCFNSAFAGPHTEKLQAALAEAEALNVVMQAAILDARRLDGTKRLPDLLMCDQRAQAIKAGVQHIIDSLDKTAHAYCASGQVCCADLQRRDGGPARPGRTAGQYAKDLDCTLANQIDNALLKIQQHCRSVSFCLKAADQLWYTFNPDWNLTARQLLLGEEIPGDGRAPGGRASYRPTEVVVTSAHLESDELAFARDVCRDFLPGTSGGMKMLIDPQINAATGMWTAAVLDPLLRREVPQLVAAVEKGQLSDCMAVVLAYLLEARLNATGRYTDEKGEIIQITNFDCTGSSTRERSAEMLREIRDFFAPYLTLLQPGNSKIHDWTKMQISRSLKTFAYRLAVMDSQVIEQLRRQEFGDQCLTTALIIKRLMELNSCSRADYQPWKMPWYAARG